MLGDCSTIKADSVVDALRRFDVQVRERSGNKFCKPTANCRYGLIFNALWINHLSGCACSIEQTSLQPKIANNREKYRENLDSSRFSPLQSERNLVLSALSGSLTMAG